MLKVGDTIKCHDKCEMVNVMVKLAKEDGYNKIFVSTNEVGLYEKYGFMYFCNMLDITGNDSRIYCKDI